MVYCDCQINLDEERERIIDYIKSKKNELIEKGLESAYIDCYQYDTGCYIEFTVSVIYINKFIDNHDYWRVIREETRRQASTYAYVSNYLYDNPSLKDTLHDDYIKII